MMFRKETNRPDMKSITLPNPFAIESILIDSFIFDITSPIAAPKLSK